MRVEIVSKGKRRKVSIRRLKKTAESILQLLNQNRVELSLALVRNPQIQKLNATYRNKNEPTDVLSFPLREFAPTGVEILGDVVISIEQAEIQARKRGKTLEEEVEALLIHGILHLLGYDHERSYKDARIMGCMEKKIQRALCGERDLRV
jgi:probable rRNA maturation factor